VRILVSGDRHYAHRDRVYAALDVLDRLNGIEAVIEGTADGADTFGGDWADLHGKEHLRFPPDWNKYHRAAGPIRNGQMLKEGYPDLVAAFHDNILESKGTADMLRQAIRAGVPVRLYEHDYVIGVMGIRKLLRMRPR